MSIYQIIGFAGVLFGALWAIYVAKPGLIYRTAVRIGEWKPPAWGHLVIVVGTVAVAMWLSSLLSDEQAMALTVGIVGGFACYLLCRLIISLRDWIARRPPEKR